LEGRKGMAERRGETRSRSGYNVLSQELRMNGTKSRESEKVSTTTLHSFTSSQTTCMGLRQVSPPIKRAAHTRSALSIQPRRTLNSTDKLPSNPSSHPGNNRRIFSRRGRASPRPTFSRLIAPSRNTTTAERKREETDDARSETILSVLKPLKVWMGPPRGRYWSNSSEWSNTSNSSNSSC